MAAETIDITPHGRLELRFHAPVHVLLLLESGNNANGHACGNDTRRSTSGARRRDLVLVPAGHDYVDMQATRGLARIACVYFDPLALPLDASVAGSPRLFFEDAELLKTALKLTEAVDMQGGDRHYCEALGIILAHDLARLAPHARRSAQKFRGGLAGWQQQTVATHIAQHLADRISVTSLAVLVGLSPYHFSRAFKQSFGMPPHRYHTHRRIERAKALLANPERSATEIGAIVGFSWASTFTMTFRKVTGITPTDYRRTLI
jgi:AraC family transcriptional regulator